MRILLPLVCVALSGCFPESTQTQVGDLRVLTFQHDYTNTHVVVGPEGKLVMIDSGLEANGERLLADLRGAGLSPNDLQAVVLTHAHADHAGGARHLREVTGAKVVVGKGDLAMLASGQNDHLCPTSDDAKARLAGDQAETYQGFAADLEVSEPTELSAFSSLQGQVVPLPGHTPGSLIVRVGQAVFVGDLLRGSVFGSSAEVHFYMCDLAANRADVNRVLDTLAPDATKFFPGHFGPLTREAVAKTFAGAR